MYAIVRIGGRQYPVEVGKTVIVEKLPYEIGKKLDLEEVLLISGEGNAEVGQPLIDGALIKAEVIDQFKGKKIIVFKYRPRKRYRVKQGHRQQYTRLLINDIVTGKKRNKKKAKEEQTEVSE